MITIYTKKDLLEILPWGENKLDEVFRRPDFPAQKQGRADFVEENALIEYFKVHHDN